MDETCGVVQSLLMKESVIETKQSVSHPLVYHPGFELGTLVEIRWLGWNQNTKRLGLK